MLQGRRCKGLLFIISIFLLWPLTLFANPIEITHMRVSNQVNKWRIVFHTSGPIQYKVLQLTHPNRIVFDIKNGQLNRNFNAALLFGTPVKDIRSGYQARNHLRLVFDMTAKMKFKSFALKPSGNNGYRLVLDIFKNKQKVLAFGWKATRKETPQPAIKKLPPQYQSQHQSSSRSRQPVLVSQPKNNKPPRNIIVVIDPGHGGKDPGATGPGGTHEKTVVLAISKDLKRIIDRLPGFTALLTRKGDYYIGLRQRLTIARRDHADMFVAIHADAYKNSYARGASVFALSQRGATSEAARWLARRENQSELMGGVELSDKSHLLKSVLISLSQTATIRSSLQIGQYIVNNLGKISILHHPRVEQAAFVVLKSPDIPSLLVESGFISNPKEEAQLRDPMYRYRIALAIMRGIREYFTQRPPRGTWLAYWKLHPRHQATMRYRVRSGDSLTSISQKFNTTIKVIRQRNHLRSDKIHVGQELIVSSRSEK